MADAYYNHNLKELILAQLDGSISPDQYQQLQHELNTNPNARKYYTEYIMLCASLKHYSGGGASSDIKTERPSLCDDAIWDILAEVEKTAPAIEQHAPQPPEIELIQHVVRTKTTRKISRITLTAAIVSIAALVFMAVYIHFVPVSRTVSILADSMDAQWGNASDALQIGESIFDTDGIRYLRAGMIKLEYDDAIAVIEAPCEFACRQNNYIEILSGRVYVTVSPGNTGFTVDTPASRIIDLGTEFGVQVETGGETQLHVMKGKTLLLAGGKTDTNGIEVNKGAAKNISGDAHTITDIPYQKTQFVRAFDSANKVVWRQQPGLDLADMVRKGNGLGTGNSSVRLDPIKGFTMDWHTGISSAANRYLQISDHPFIDGVFVPDSDSKQVVSSRGDVFDECPDTSGLYDVDLFANPKPEMLKTEFRGAGTIRFDGQEYTDQSGRSCIIMHANRGLTFDLDAIRNNYRRSIDRFTSRIGIADLKESCPCNADFYVLVDGQIRYSLRQYKQKGVLNDVSIDIRDTDRFLTLITTDGGDTDNPQGNFYQRAISCDWCVFTDPILILD